MCVCACVVKENHGFVKLLSLKSLSKVASPHCLAGALSISFVDPHLAQKGELKNTLRV